MTSKLTAYLHDVLGISVSATAWSGEAKVPFFLREQYRFYQINMFDQPCLLMVANSEEELAPAAVAKQWKAVSEYWQEDVIYVTEVCSAYNRKRLIEHKVPFIVPGNQMYLPMLGCAAMSMTRAARELENLELSSIHKDGRKQQIKFNASGKGLWQLAWEKMVNPVRKRIWIASAPDHWQGVLAGESALARYSMLAEPKYPVYALTSSGWNSIRRNMAVEEISHPESGCAQLELWRYSPERLAEQGCVDRYSLWLSMQDIGDERIDMALEDMMEAQPWQ